MKTDSNKGFSMVELLVVIAVIAVLAALVLGGASYMHKKAIDVRCRAEFATLELAIETYKSDHGYYPREYSGRPQPPAGSSLADIIAWNNDNLKKKYTSSTLARALVQNASTLALNDYKKAYLYHGKDITLSGISKFVDVGGAMKQIGGTGAYRLLNPNGSEYVYDCPGANNWGHYDLSVGGPLGTTYRNWRLKND